MCETGKGQYVAQLHDSYKMMMMMMMVMIMLMMVMIMNIQSNPVITISLYKTPRLFFFAMARQPLGGLGRLIFRGFTITHFRHTTVGRTTLDEGTARRRDLYLIKHNTHKRQTSMP
jgi:hypothetical protein